MRGLGQVANQIELTTPHGGQGAQIPVGDSFTLKLEGAAPGQPVTALGIHDGVANSTAPLQIGDPTDANGNWSYSGTFGPEVAGKWLEFWYVGGNTVGSLQFEIVPAAGQAKSAAPNTAAAAPAAASGNWLTGSMMGVSNWLWLGAAGLAGYWWYSEGRR